MPPYLDRDPIEGSFYKITDRVFAEKPPGSGGSSPGGPPTAAAAAVLPISVPSRGAETLPLVRLCPTRRCPPVSFTPRTQSERGGGVSSPTLAGRARPRAATAVTTRATTKAFSSAGILAQSYGRGARCCRVVGDLRNYVVVNCDSSCARYRG
jgi:hypothetical protein